MNFLKFLGVPFVYHMCAYSWWHYYRFRIEKYGQFPFQRRVKRQKRTFLAPCGFSESLVNFGHFGQFLLLDQRGGQNHGDSDPLFGHATKTAQNDQN